MISGLIFRGCSDPNIQACPAIIKFHMKIRGSHVRVFLITSHMKVTSFKLIRPFESGAGAKRNYWSALSLAGEPTDSHFVITKCDLAMMKDHLRWSKTTNRGELSWKPKSVLCSVETYLHSSVVARLWKGGGVYGENLYPSGVIVQKFYPHRILTIEQKGGFTARLRA